MFSQFSFHPLALYSIYNRNIIHILILHNRNRILFCFVTITLSLIQAYIAGNNNPVFLIEIDQNVHISVSGNIHV